MSVIQSLSGNQGINRNEDMMSTTWGGMGIKRYTLDGVEEPLLVLVNAKRREKGIHRHI